MPRHLGAGLEIPWLAPFSRSEEAAPCWVKRSGISVRFYAPLGFFGLSPLSDDCGAVVGEAAGFVEEVVVSAGVGGDFPSLYVEHFSGKFSDEVHVVRDEDEGAFVLFEGEDEGFDGDDVEVGGWFVH